MPGVLLALLAMLAELACGYPDRLYRSVGHPVTWIGWLIAALDRGLNRPGTPEGWRKAAGVIGARGGRGRELGGGGGGGVARAGDARRDRRRPCGEHAPGAAQPRWACGGGGAGRWRRGAAGRAGGGRAHRRARRGEPGRGGGGAGCGREPGRELRRRGGGAGASGRRCWGCRAGRPTRRSTPPTA